MGNRQMAHDVSARNSRRHGFTLIELLVVISIIALLLSVIMPSLGKARRAAQMAACASQIKQIGATFIMYAMDNQDILPPAYASGNWNVIYDFVRDSFQSYNADAGGRIFYCPAIRPDGVIDGVENAWDYPVSLGNGANGYYMGYQVFTNPVRADFRVHDSRFSGMRPWPLANGIDTIPGFSNAGTLSWHFNFISADPDLRNVVPAQKTTDTTVPVAISGNHYSVRIRPDSNPMLFDQAMSRDGVFNVYRGDTVHTDGRSGCHGVNAVYMDGHAQSRRHSELKVFRDYGPYGEWNSLQKWF